MEKRLPMPMEGREMEGRAKVWNVPGLDLSVVQTKLEVESVGRILRCMRDGEKSKEK